MPRSYFESIPLLTSVTVNGNGPAVDTGGYDAAQQVQIAETGGGTATVVLQGSIDGTNWFTVGYQQIDAIAAPARSVTAISVTAHSAHVYQVLDPYPQLRAVVSAVAAGAVVSATIYCIGS